MELTSLPMYVLYVPYVDLAGLAGLDWTTSTYLLGYTLGWVLDY